MADRGLPNGTPGTAATPPPPLIETGGAPEARQDVSTALETEPPPATGQACDQAGRRPRGTKRVRRG